MGSSSKKYKEKEKEKESRKRRHHSPSYSEEQESTSKRHRHKRHHKDRKREKSRQDYDSDGSDVVEVVTDDKSEEPTASGSVDSLSIEETNKLRAKLGLKPLEVSTQQSSSSTTENRKDDGKKKDDWGEFYHKPAENLAHKTEQEKLREKLALRKERRHLETKLNKTKLLADSDSDDNIESWVVKSRQLDDAKKQAEKRAKILEELDEQFGVGDIVDNKQKRLKQKQYTEKHLKGLRVEHDVDNLAEEKVIVLTLKDKDVLKDDDDVLINVNLIDDERSKKNVENKTKKLTYNPYDTEEYDELGNLKEKSLLSQYDDEIDGEKRSSFTIGVDSIAERRQQYQIQETIKAKLAKKKIESILDKDLKIASEYYNEEELAKFKKPKKKNRKIRNKTLTADDLEQNLLNKGIEEIGTRRRPKHDDIEDRPVELPTTELKIEDDRDDLLEKALHKTRKVKQKENLIVDMIKTLPIKSETTDDSIDSGNIVLNSTAEFCRTLGDIPTYGKSGNRDETEEIIDFDKDIKNDDEIDDLMRDDEQLEPKTGWNSVDPNEIKETTSSTTVTPQDVQILDEEPDVSTGVGAALKLAMSKGYLDKEQNNRPSNSRLAHLQAKHYSIEDKTYGDEYDRTGRRERYAGPIIEFKEKDTFKPNVKLEYIDDDGHILNSKEAFRYLSHKFHGKGPGKNKIEKRLKKAMQEQLMKKMSSTDTPLGTLNMLQQKQKETQSPFVVLSGSKQSQATVISKTRR